MCNGACPQLSFPATNHPKVNQVKDQRFYLLLKWIKCIIVTFVIMLGLQACIPLAWLNHSLCRSNSTGTHDVAQTGLQLFVSCLSLPNTGITSCLAFKHLIVVLASVGQETSQGRLNFVFQCLEPLLQSWVAEVWKYMEASSSTNLAPELGSERPRLMETSGKWPVPQECPKQEF